MGRCRRSRVERPSCMFQRRARDAEKGAAPTGRALLTFESNPSAALLNRLIRRAPMEQVLEVEAVADAAADGHRIEIDLGDDIAARDGRITPSGGRIEPGFLDVEVQVPALPQSPIEARLQRDAEGIGETHAAGLHGVGSGVGAEESDVLRTDADVGLEGAHAIEVILQRQSRRKDPRLRDRTGQRRCSRRWPQVDMVLGEAAQQLDRDVLAEEIGQRCGRKETSLTSPSNPAARRSVPFEFIDFTFSSVTR